MQSSNLSAPNVLCIMGPTASGKTDIAIALSEYTEIDIISVDSALVYKGMNIGTAKPDESILAKYPHQIVDVVHPNEEYTVKHFCQHALECIQHSHKKQRLPVLVGGTSFYFHALEHGLSDIPQSTTESREWVNTLIHTKGLACAYEELQKVDMMSAERIHAHDTQRISRALEVYYLTGTTLSGLQGNKYSPLEGYILHKFALLPEKEVLNERIALRFRHMIAAGFVAEVERLVDTYQLTEQDPALRCVGYRQIYQYLRGELSLDEAIERGIIATRQLAKKQRTWLRSMENVEILHPPYHIERLLQSI